MCLKKKYILITIFNIFIFFTVFAQESLKSIQEDYYDFLSLQGKIKRPTLNFRTLSDNQWDLAEKKHLWGNNNLGSFFTLYETQNQSNNVFSNGIKQNISLRIYGPEWLNSYNTAAPFGQNDGALWQGKGYNTSISGGFRLEGYGFELTFKPQVAFTENLAFDYISPNYKGSDFEGKASVYGYYGVKYVDAPQRFGDDFIFSFDWGDSELRYTWKNFSLGFGTQSIWLGPAKINPILHSNNAVSYPKLDIGFRRQEVVLPWIDLYIGDIELRGWWGKLSESEYFDNNEENNHNLISGLSLAWALPGTFEGLTLGINRTMISKWNNINPYTLFEIFIPSLGTSGGTDVSDQRFSFIADYLFPESDFEVYLEWARNDFSPSMDFIIRYPFHTQAWTFGMQKAYQLPKDFQLQILFELTFLEVSADYLKLIGWPTSFYVHHAVKQGYTNAGQWLGAGIGTGGNSQYLGFRIYHSKGSIDLFFQRKNPDLDYTMLIDAGAAESPSIAERNIRAMVDIGITTNYYISSNLSLWCKYVFENEHNPQNISDIIGKSIIRNNNHFEMGLRYIF